MSWRASQADLPRFLLTRSDVRVGKLSSLDEDHSARYPVSLCRHISPLYVIDVTPEMKIITTHLLPSTISGKSCHTFRVFNPFFTGQSSNFDIKFHCIVDLFILEQRLVFIRVLIYLSWNHVNQSIISEYTK